MIDKSDHATVTPSCGNVFADLGLPNADELLAMSHRAFDDIAALRCRLADVEAEIAAVRAARVVDFGKLADLRQTRDTLVGQLEASHNEEIDLLRRELADLRERVAPVVHDHVQFDCSCAPGSLCVNAFCPRRSGGASYTICGPTT